MLQKNHVDRFVFTLLFLSCFTVLKGQIINYNEMPRYYYKTARIKNWKEYTSMRDVFHSDKLLMGRNIFSGNVAMNTGRVVVDDGKNLHYMTRSALSFFTRILIVEEFSLNTTFYKNFNQKSDVVWLSDYTYSIGRYNWRPHKLNFGYENYINNRYSDNWETTKQKFLQGYYFISIGQNLWFRANEKIKIDSTSNIRFNYFIRHSLKYKDRFDQIHGGFGKTSAGIAAQYVLFRNFYIESAIYYYLNAESVKQPWDPDYTFGFGFFDYRPFRFSIIYGNWVINRFPWSKEKSLYPYYNALDGNLKVMFNYSW